MKKTFRIVSRKSALALWQANHIKAKLSYLHPELEITIIGIQTEGDKTLETPLYEVGGKGLFVKALEEYLLENKADIAVHSLKDMPAELPEGLELSVILEREDPRDAFISKVYPSLESLPPNARVGTSSLRRQCQLATLRPDLNPLILRGNVDTRVQKLDRGEYDAILLAVAGMKRLGLENRLSQILPANKMLPAVGQGALSIECRKLDEATKSLIKPLHHLPTAQCVFAERSMNALLGGGCQLPVAGLATIQSDGQLTLNGLVGSKDGKIILKASASGEKEQGIAIGKKVAEQLLVDGAKEIIKACEEGT